MTLLAAALLIAFGCYIALRSYRAEAVYFSAQQHAVDPTSTAAALGAVRNVAFSVDGAELRGVYASSQNGAGIVLCHGSGGDRNALLTEARALHEGGFGVLLYDSPGHGESGGIVHWNEGEVRAVRAAVSALIAQPGIDALRIGGFGFSMGGYIMALAAAQDHRIRAVALAGAPGDARKHTHWEYRRWGAISQWPALWAISRNGMALDGPTPLSTIAQIAPNPLLLIGGSADTAVPTWMLNELLTAAREPKRLYVVEGGQHGDYANAPGSDYLAQLRAFFAASLLPRN